MSNKMITGRHAREAVRSYFAVTDGAHVCADGLLRHLEKQELIITQRPYRAPVRRGNEMGPLIGKSHSAALTGGAR